jgi:hypothetical protein
MRKDEVFSVVIKDQLIMIFGQVEDIVIHDLEGILE